MAPTTSYCHGCGYELGGLHVDRCPECGTTIEADIAMPCEEFARRPLGRFLHAVTGRTVPTGWWALVSPRRATAARLELLAALLLATLAYAVFFAAGSNVAVVIRREVLGITALQAGIAVRHDRVLENSLPLAILANADRPSQSPFRTATASLSGPRTGAPPGPSRSVQPSAATWSPYFLARLAWLSCGPAFAFLAMRFVLLRLVAGRRGFALMSPAAADLSTASAAAACCVLTLAVSAALFAAAAWAPLAVADAIIPVAPWIVAALMILGPPALLARQIGGDRSRRIFASPTVAAAAAVGVYVVALALTVVAMGLTFRLSLWVLT